MRRDLYVSIYGRLLNDIHINLSTFAETLI